MKLIFCLIACLAFSGCASFRIKGQLTYQGQYGDYTLGSDGKSVIIGGVIRERKLPARGILTGKPSDGKSNPRSDFR